MKIAIMQPYLFPFIDYYRLISSVDRFIFLDDANYIKKGWVNRNRILINGAPSFFTLPLVKASQNKKINELYIFEKEKWLSRFFTTLRHSYQKAPHYAQTLEVLDAGLRVKSDNLHQVILSTINEVARYLSIQTEIVPSVEVYACSRFKGQERIIEVCLKAGAKSYLNASGGRDLYDPQSFRAAGLELSFLEARDISYFQFGDKFIENLSIIDAMMFMSQEQLITLVGDSHHA